MALMNSGVNKNAHCKHVLAGSFGAPLSVIFTDQQAVGSAEGSEPAWKT